VTDLPVGEALPASMRRSKVSADPTAEISKIGATFLLRDGGRDGAQTRNLTMWTKTGTLRIPSRILSA
jgi:hypothetical protein